MRAPAPTDTVGIEVVPAPNNRRRLSCAFRPILAIPHLILVGGPIAFAGRHPDGLWSLAAFYLRWRVRAVAYFTLLCDEYPPFGDGDYPAVLQLEAPVGPRDRLTVGFRFFLALPHIVVVSLLGVLWAIGTAVAWIMILFTGEYPARLYRFAVGMLRWSTRVEAYLLLLRDEYPPFSFD